MNDNDTDKNKRRTVVEKAPRAPPRAAASFSGHSTTRVIKTLFNRLYVDFTGYHRTAIRH